MAVKHATQVKTKTVKMTGLDEVVAVLEALGVDIRKATAGALNDAGNSILMQSNQLVPFDQGVLKGSGSVASPKLTKTSKTTSVGVRYGGPSGVKNAEGETVSVNYAIIQHEDLSLKHPGGGEAKFLEKAFLAEIKSYPAGLGRRIKDQGLDQL